jgi:methionyl-tRNA formyltransferase
MARLAFMGSPEFAVPALTALHRAGHDIAAVYCQPPRPAGRGQARRACAVQRAAEAMGLAVRTPERLRRDEATQAAFAELRLDAAVVAAYGLILPPAMLDAPAFGCLNIHASLLPRWRGAAPIQAAILAGDGETGITIMRMDPGLDTGPMLLQGRVRINAQTTAPALQDALAEMGAELILRALEQDLPSVPQPAEGASYAPKLTRADGAIDWSLPAAVLERRVRALNPWPGTETVLDGAPFKIRAAALADGGGDPGQVLDDRLTVACGEGALRLLRVQAPGRAAMAGEVFLRGRPVPAGTRLG